MPFPPEEKVDLVNKIGSPVFSKELDSQVEKIDVSDLPVGIYIIKVIHDRAVNVGKFVFIYPQFRPE
jgi:hypothetical protein